MYKKYLVRLTPDQRADLLALVTSGQAPALTQTHARILLKADTAPGAPAWPDRDISDALDVSLRSIARVRQACCQAGLDRAIHRKPPADRHPTKLDGALEAQVVAVVCSPPPAGHLRWTLRLVSERIVELTDLDSLSHESVRTLLKKTHLNLGCASSGAYRPVPTPAS